MTTVHRAALAVVAGIALIGGLVWLGMQADPVQPARSTSTPGGKGTPAPPPLAPEPEPEPALALVPPDPELTAEFAQLSAELGGTYALAWVDADGLHVLGEAADETAWSTIKVPLAIAGMDQPTDATAALVERAITASDNDAALGLWSGLGQPTEAARAVDEVLAAYGSAGTRTESREVRPSFSSFGQTAWSVADQARFASALACATEESPAGQVREAMGRVVPDHQWGIGRLDEAHIKGGWGPGEDGAYVVRQLGDAVVADDRYALAGSARARTGSYAQGAADLSALIRWWAATAAPEGAGLECG